MYSNENESIDNLIEYINIEPQKRLSNLEVNIDFDIKSLLIITID